MKISINGHELIISTNERGELCLYVSEYSQFYGAIVKRPAVITDLPVILNVEVKNDRSE